MTLIQVTRALISVYDKTGLDDLARGLADAGVEIVSTGSTAARIRELGVPVTPVEEVTGFAEILGGRVKTLHPHVHAGLLADPTDPAHVETMDSLGIRPFQLLVVNLYPFAATAASGATPPEVIEQIDIGGPAMVRASAKNHASVAVVTDPARYADVLRAVRSGGFDLATRQRLAVEAFRHTATYDIAVASWLGSAVGPDDEVDGRSSGFPGWVAASWERAAVLRYGENPHQRAALYLSPGSTSGLAAADQLQGKEMSYNNYVDADVGWRAAHDFDQPCVAIIKHANPCGIAVGTDVADAHRKAHACDPTSAFGGVIATNRPVTGEMAEFIATIGDIARLLNAELVGDGSRLRPHAKTHKTREMVQLERDAGIIKHKCATLAEAEMLASAGATVGIGMGQVNRVDSCRLAVDRAGERATGAVAASDAFFPFADGPAALIDAGVRAIVEPGGSIRDDETIAAAKDANVTLFFTGTRHFAH